MNILERPDLMEALAAEHALGTLRGGARRRLEALASQSAELRDAMAAWSLRMQALTELQPESAAPARVWEGISRELGMGRGEPAPRPIQELPRSGAARLPAEEPARGGWLAWLGLGGGAGGGWRAGACAAAACAAVAVGFSARMAGELGAARTELARGGAELAATRAGGRFVAVLADESGAPQLFVSRLPGAWALRAERVGGFAEGPDRSLQLWAIGDDGKAVSLGLLASGGDSEMPGSERIDGAKAIAVSLEARGGVDGSAGPKGPVLWKGAVLRVRA